MRVTGARKLSGKLQRLPDATRRHVTDAIEKSAQEGARVARLLAPRGATGELQDSITYSLHDGGMTATITAGADTRRSQIKANTVEGGRDANTRGGRMEPQKFIGPARAYLAKKHKARIARAVRRAAKEVGGNG